MRFVLFVGLCLVGNFVLADERDDADQAWGGAQGALDFMNEHRSPYDAKWDQVTILKPAVDIKKNIYDTQQHRTLTNTVGSHYSAANTARSQGAANGNTADINRLDGEPHWAAGPPAYHANQFQTAIFEFDEAKDYFGIAGQHYRTGDGQLESAIADYEMVVGYIKDDADYHRDMSNMTEMEAAGSKTSAYARRSDANTKKIAAQAALTAYFNQHGNDETYQGAVESFEAGEDFALEAESALGSCVGAYIDGQIDSHTGDTAYAANFAGCIDPYFDAKEAYGDAIELGLTAQTAFEQADYCFDLSIMRLMGP